MPTPRAAAKRQIQDLVEYYRSHSQDQRKALSETDVVNHFITPLFTTLGWPTNDTQRYRYEQTTVSGRPDITFIPEPETVGRIYVEAKRFGVIKGLDIARRTLAGTFTPGQLALPGMATDRTREEQQAINYAFENHGTWAILTDFKHLRLFNARRDWLVLSFEHPSAYLDDFDLLWALSYSSIRAGSLDDLSNRRHREDVDTSYLSFINEWRQRLPQDIVENLDVNPWAVDDGGNIRLPEIRAVVQRILDRLVVVRFAEDHLIIPSETLYQFLELNRNNRYTFSLSDFFQQLFRRFDHYHNSSLFAPDLADDAVFSDDVLADLVNKLYEARYRAMSADIMGNTYEQYLGKTLVQTNGNVATADNLETRKKQGSYYTPQVIVRYLVDNSLGRYLYSTANGKPDGEPLPDEPRKTYADVRDLRVIDPACGSGGFLIYAYRVLADFYRSEIRRLQHEREKRRQELQEQGITVPFEVRLELAPFNAALERLQDYPHIILEQHLYGVDLDPQAAELATVNLIMRAMADQTGSRKRLPLILNQNIKVGNSLIGDGPEDPRYAEHSDGLAQLRRLRLQLRTGGHEDDHHEETMAAIEAIEARLNEALNEDLQQYFTDVSQHRPFHWAVEFPEVFVDENGQHLGEHAGFTVVVGNPPWEIVKPDLREFYAQFDPDIESRMTRREVEQRLKELVAEDPRRREGWISQKQRIEQASWYYGHSEDFARQGRGDTATHKLFTERNYSLLRSQGRLGLVLPSGIYTDLGTQPLRELLLDAGRIEYLYSFSNERFFFPHVDHRFKFTMLGAQKGVEGTGFWAVFRFNPRVAVTPEELPSFVSNMDNLIFIRNDSVERFSPDSLSIMEFKSQTDYNVTDLIYGNRPLLGQKLTRSWDVRLNNEFHMTHHRHLFNQQSGVIAVYNGRMIHQFDPHFAPHEFWISADKVPEIRESTSDQSSWISANCIRHQRTYSDRHCYSAKHNL